MALAAAVAPALLAGQERAAPFSGLTASAGVGVDLSDDRFLDGWDAGPAATLSVRFPWHVGYLELGGSVLGYDATAPGRPDFVAAEPWVAMGVARPLADGLRGSLSLRFGLSVFVFDSTGLSGQTTESEATAGVAARISRELGGGWGVAGEAAWSTVFTRPRLTPLRLGLSVERRFALPGTAARALGAAGTGGAPGEPGRGGGTTRAGPRTDGAAHAAPHPPPTAPGVRWIEGDALRRAGVYRLSDLLALAGEWSLQSTDQLDWRTSARGLLPFDPVGGGSLRVVIDGAPVELELLGQRALDRIPLAVDDIVRVGFDASGLPTGGWTPRGATLWIETRARPTGVRLTELWGNETGDAGPYAFTELAVDNVDRFADDQTVGGALAADPGWVAVDRVVRGHIGSGPRTFERNRTLLGSFPFLPGEGWSGSAGIGGAARVRIFRSELDDLLHLAPLGRERPLRSVLEHASLGAGRAVAGGRGSGGVALTRNRAEPREAAPDVRTDLRLRAAEAWARWEAGGAARGLLSAGVRVREVDVSAGHGVRDGAGRTVLADVAVGARTGAGSAWEIRALGTGGRGGLESTLAALAYRPIAAGWRGVGALAWTRAAAHEAGSLAWLEARGLDLVAAGGSPLEVDEGAGTFQRVTASAPPPPRTGRSGLRAELWAHAFPGLETERQGLDRLEGPVPFLGTRRRTAAGGGVGGGSLVWSAGGEAGSVRAAVHGQGVLWGGGAFRDAWDGVPALGGAVEGRARPFPDLRAFLRLRWRSGATRSRWEGVAVRSGARYDERVHGGVRLDGAVEKSFLSERLLGTLGFRGLGGPQAWHPVGEVKGFVAFLRADLRLERGR